MGIFKYLNILISAPKNAQKFKNITLVHLNYLKTVSCHLNLIKLANTGNYRTGYH
jgi:hypothetical protein